MEGVSREPVKYLWRFIGAFEVLTLEEPLCCICAIAAEQKARVTYDNILRMTDDPDVRDPIKFLRQREIVHYQRFGDALRIAQDHLDSKNFYAYNPSFDKRK